MTDKKEGKPTAAVVGTPFIFVSVQLRKTGIGRQHPIFHLGLTSGQRYQDAMDVQSFAFAHPDAPWDAEYKKNVWCTSVESRQQLADIEKSAKDPVTEWKRVLSYLDDLERKYDTRVTFVVDDLQDLSDIDHALYTILDRDRGIRYAKVAGNDSNLMRRVTSINDRLAFIPVMEMGLHKGLHQEYAQAHKLVTIRADDHSQQVLCVFFLIQISTSQHREAEQRIFYMLSEIKKSLTAKPSPASPSLASPEITVPASPETMVAVRALQPATVQEAKEDGQQPGSST
jgi:hypothetical protein